MNYRMTFYPVLVYENEAVIQKQYKTKEEAFAAVNACADMLLMLQDDLHLMADYSNMGGVEELIDGEWLEIEEKEED